MIRKLFSKILRRLGYRRTFGGTIVNFRYGGLK